MDEGRQLETSVTSLDEPLAQYRAAVELAPDDATFHWDLANALFDLGRKDEAVAQYRAAVELAPDDAMFHRDLANALFDLGRADDAIAHAGTLQKPGLKAQYLDNLGDRLREFGRKDEALAQYRAAVKLAPDNATFHRDLANALFDLGQTDDADREYRSLVADNGEYLIDYARELSTAGKTNEASATYRLALKRRYDQLTVLSRFSDHLVRIGNVEEAIRLYTDALERQSAPETDLRQGLSDLYARLGWPDKALRELNQAELITVDRGGTLAVKTGWIHLYALGNAAEAAKHFTISLSSPGTRLDRGLLLAEALTRVGRWAEAKEFYEQAIRTSLEPRARFVWGYAQMQRENYREAYTEYQNCPPAAGNFTYAGCRHNLAWILERQYRYSEARQEWLNVLRLYADHARRYDIGLENDDLAAADLYSFMASIAADQGEYHDAVDFVKRALVYDPRSIHALVVAAQLYTDMRDNGLIEKYESYWHAREASTLAQEIVREHATHASGSPVVIDELISVAEALIALGDLPAAERLLQYAAAYDRDNVTLELATGVLRAAQDNYEAAAGHFRRAMSLRPTNLKAQSNLGEALFKLGKRSEAETTYRKILSVSDLHVETLVGLAEVYTAMGEAGEEPEDSYSKAIDYFSRAIQISDSRQGSKVLTKKEMSAALYSRGYANVKLFEAGNPIGNTSRLTNALKDFRDSRNLDNERDKAKLAAGRVEQRLKRAAADRISHIVGPVLVGSLALVVFILAQLSFFIGKPLSNFPPAYHAALTFGSLIFVIASLYLPSLLRLKLAGIELEKKPVEQIGTSTPLGISR
jgi:tetratricopeptide (TPR) repeat protein